MKDSRIRYLLFAIFTLLFVGTVAHSREKAEPPLAHMVFFAVKDHSSEARQKLVAACQKYLSGHDGTVSFSVGTRAEDVKEPVSDVEFDVAVHVVFEGKAAKEKYLTNPRHIKFVEENKSLFGKVRVFDPYLAAP
jgi:hypothetical protein